MGASMHKSSLGGLIIDCNTDELERDAEFWSQVLGYGIRPEREDDKYIELDVPPGRPYIELQRVDHDSRVHLDIKTDDLEAEVKRLEKLGATIVERIDYWCVMVAPGGHRFCVIPLHPGQDVGDMNTWQ